MNKYLLVLFSTINSLSLLPQMPIFKWGNLSTIEITKNTVLLGNNESSFFIYDSKSQIINKVINLSAKKENEQKIEIPKVNGELVADVNMICLADQPILIYRHNNKKEKTYSVYAHKINTDGTLDLNYKIIDVIKYVSNKDWYFFNISISEDGNKLLIASLDVPQEKKNENLKYRLKIIDKEVNTLLTKEFELANSDITSDLKDFYLNKEGNIFFRALLVKKNKVKGTLKYENKLISYYPKLNKVTETLLNSDNKHIFDLKYKSDNKGNLILAALCSKKEIENYRDGPNWQWKLREIYGSYFIQINQSTGGVIAEKVSEIPNETNDRKKWDYYLKDLIVFENGTVNLICEHKYTGTGTTYYYHATRGKIMIPDEHADQILIISHENPTYKVSTFKIPKRQVCAYFNYQLTSYMLFTFSNNFYLIFNRDKAEVEGQVVKEGTTMLHSPSKLEEPITSCFNFSKKPGETKFFPNEKNALLCRLAVSLTDNNKIILVKTEDGYKFCKITFI